MKARQLIDSASFGSDTLKLIEQAFDEAWARIAGNFEENLWRYRQFANAMLAEPSRWPP